jgi:hypothetical protein
VAAWDKVMNLDRFDLARSRATAPSRSEVAAEEARRTVSGAARSS